jgi:hypothetical protein
MRDYPFPDIPCVICSQPLNLRIDLFADENGKAVHEDCYVERIMSSSRNLASTVMAD